MRVDRVYIKTCPVTWIYICVLAFKSNFFMVWLRKAFILYNWFERQRKASCRTWMVISQHRFWAWISPWYWRFLAHERAWGEEGKPNARELRSGRTRQVIWTYRFNQKSFVRFTTQNLTEKLNNGFWLDRLLTGPSVCTQRYILLRFAFSLHARSWISGFRGGMKLRFYWALNSAPIQFDIIEQIASTPLCPVTFYPRIGILYLATPVHQISITRKHWNFFTSSIP